MSAPTGYAYQWYRNGAAISGATSANYTLATADIGDTLTCKVTASNSAGSVTEMTAATPAISAAGGSTSARFVGFTADVTNRNGMQGKQITSSSVISPRTLLPGGVSTQSAPNIPTYLESFTDYLEIAPWPAIIGCFMNDNDKYTPSGASAPNIAPLYFGAGASTSTSQDGYPTFQGQLTGPSGLTASPPFYGAPYKDVSGGAAKPAIPIISWDLGSTSIIDIANGVHDTDTLIPAAIACKNWPADSVGNPAYGSQPGGQVIIRFCHEMNGAWSGYCPGNKVQPTSATPASFVNMWRHVVQVFADQGATNARWLWCPNVFGSAAAATSQGTWNTGSGTVAAMYPGDAYVDYVGIDGYNYAANSTNWQTFAQVFQSSYNGIYVGDSHTKIPGATAAGPITANKKCILGEIGCWETDELANVPSGQSKGQWFRDMITDVPNTMPNIIGACYWYENPGSAGNQTSVEYYISSSSGSVSGWNALAESWNGRPAVVVGVTAALA